MVFALILFLIALVLSILFIVYAFIYLSSVPERLREISFYMRRISEAMEDKSSNVHKQSNVSSVDLEQSVREDFENSTTLR